MDGVDVQYMIALDKKTGKNVWKTDRTAEWNDLDSDGKPIKEGDMRKAYSTPLLAEVNGKIQMITAGAKAAYGYDPTDGREIWKVRYAAYSAAPRPVLGNGLAYILTGFGKSELLAIRPDGRGDVTDTHVLWKTGRTVPKTPSPVLIDKMLFSVNDSGTVMCLNALTGEEIWKQRIGGNYAASLLYADGCIFSFSQEGVTTVFKAGSNYEVLATNKLDGGFMASPAVSGGSLFLRTKTHLYRIESAANNKPVR
jgi:outer membrane protein assembly factor BamB